MLANFDAIDCLFLCITGSAEFFFLCCFLQFSTKWASCFLWEGKSFFYFHILLNETKFRPLNWLIIINTWYFCLKQAILVVTRSYDFKRNNSVPEAWCLEAQIVASNLRKHVDQLWCYRLLISLNYGKRWFFFLWCFLQFSTKSASCFLWKSKSCF